MEKNQLCLLSDNSRVVANNTNFCLSSFYSWMEPLGVFTNFVKFKNIEIDNLISAVPLETN